MHLSISMFIQLIPLISVHPCTRIHLPKILQIVVAVLTLVDLSNRLESIYGSFWFLLEPTLLEVFACTYDWILFLF